MASASQGTTFFSRVCDSKAIHLNKPFTPQNEATTTDFFYLLLKKNTGKEIQFFKTTKENITNTYFRYYFGANENICYPKCLLDDHFH